MNYREQPLTIDCDGDVLVAIATIPEAPRTTTGLLVVVGGPQYRVGSHRQFVLLCRALAEKGIPCMRFDYRGMGDATGEQRSFESIDSDIRTAANCFFDTVPGLDGLVLWGLCDGASAACFYAPTDERIAGLVLLNPWVRTEAGEARTYVKHYYLRRLVDREFWKKLMGGGVAIGDSVSSVFRALRLAGAPRPAESPEGNHDLPTRMAMCLEAAALPRTDPSTELVDEVSNVIGGSFPPCGFVHHRKCWTH
jgi:exosortase A-associated hydrolase 1